MLDIGTTTIAESAAACQSDTGSQGLRDSDTSSGWNRPVLGEFVVLKPKLVTGSFFARSAYDHTPISELVITWPVYSLPEPV